MKTETKTPEVGQHVWVTFLNVRPAKEGGGLEVVAKITEKEFYRVKDHYGSERGPFWICGPFGKRDIDPSAPWGIAYRPERVFLTEKEAANNLYSKSKELIEQIQTAVSKA